MTFTDWASAISNMVMAASSIGVIIVSYCAIYLRAPNPPRHPPCSAIAGVEALRRELEALKQRLTDLEPPCPAITDVEALQRKLEELKQRLTDLGQLRERLVGTLY